MSSVDAGSLVGERLGKYHLLALMAIGGTAEIYLARIAGEAGFEKYVVVKCLLDHLADDADFVRMFLDEARLCAQLEHSNIVQTLELNQHEGRFYMVMEHLAGMSLAQLARKTHERVPGGLIPTRLVLGLAAQACAGLHYAHQRTGADGAQLNVVHRDVSPQNLVVTFEGMLKIVDFGIAKADLRQTHTRSGTIKGKFAYMSPEQCLAEPIDRRTDVFALGTVVHELLTARRLFKRASTYETYQAILKGNSPPPSRYNDTVDEDLDRVVLRALAYDKKDRYETTEAFGEAMLSWLHSRAQSVSATDVARYVEQVCAPELEDHAEHMRELISGHRVGRSETLRWDSAAEEEAESNSLGASPLGSNSGIGLDLAPTDYADDDEPGAIEPRLVRRSAQQDDDFAGDTQIELDPMERVAELEAAAGAPVEGRGPAGKPHAGAGPAGNRREPADPLAATAALTPMRTPGGLAAGRGPVGPGGARGHSSAGGPLPGGAPRGAASDPVDAGWGDAPDAGPGGAGGAARPAPGAGATAGDDGHFPPATLRPRGDGSEPPGGGRRRANDPTQPEVAIGGSAHDERTIPASDMAPSLAEAAAWRPASSPISIYETPRPVAGPGWGDDSAEVLRQGRPSRPGPAQSVSAPMPVPQAPDLSGSLPHSRPTLLRPPPASAPVPAPTPGPPPRSDAPPFWLLAVAFLVSAGVGLGLTVLIGSLIA